MLRSRLELPTLFKDKGYQTGAEIGVFDGYFSEYMCQQIPGLRLFSIDPWAVYAGYRDHKFESSMRSAENKARQRLSPFDVKIIKKFSAEAVKEFNDESLDFVYIDGNHEYKYVKEDIELWTPKVKKGGIVAGDDYYFTRAGNVGVIKAVNDYARDNGYDLQITLWDLDAPVVDDRQPAWWWIK